VRFSSRRLLAAVAAIAVVGASYALTFGRSTAARALGGGANLQLIREASRVEAYRLAPPAGLDPQFDDVPPLDYYVVSGPIVASDSIAEQLKETLLASETYPRRWMLTTECGRPVYGVKLSFIRGGERLDVYLCFSCSELVVRRNDTTHAPAYFGPGKRVLVDAAKRLFPNDSAIQQIPE
jgi:hypothetical protein